MSRVPHPGLQSFITLVIVFSLLTGGLSQSPVFKQIWIEEFTPCNTASCINGVNTSRWSFELGDGSKYGPYLSGWGNNEVQCYTAQNFQALSSGSGARGLLSIEARFQPDGFTCVNPGAPSSTKWWTSARLITRGKASFAPGLKPIKVEARVKFPAEWGAWAAFWMLPDTPREDCLACGAYGNSWCTSGEIDIMETRNRDGVIRSVVHYGGLRDQPYLDCRQAMVDYNVSAVSSPAYWTRVSVVWSNTSISFYVNDTLTQTVPQSQWFTGAANKTTNPQAPFDQPFYLLLNLAVGGNFPTSQTGGVFISDTRRAYRLLVDWVKVFQQV